MAVLAAALALVSSPAVASADTHPEWGHTAAADARILKGCHRYSYSYALTPPDGDWQLETFLVGPHGRQYGSGWFITGDPLVGRSGWRLCQRVVRPGTYTIRALLTVDDAVATYAGWLPDTTFRLSARRR
jgi:hypothetical protein